MEIRPFADNFIPIIFVDHKEHTASRPFCWNPQCPCHEDREAIVEINKAVQDGLMTSEEATLCVRGKLV